MTSESGKQIIETCIFLNISRGNGNQTMKFGQLIEYEMSEKSFTKCIPSIPRSFSKKPIQHISGSIV